MNKDYFIEFIKKSLKVRTRKTPVTYLLLFLVENIKGEYDYDFKIVSSFSKAIDYLVAENSKTIKSFGRIDLKKPYIEDQKDKLIESVIAFYEEYGNKEK